MSEPSPAATRAAEAAREYLYTRSIAISDDEAEDIAAIIERETGIGEAEKLIAYIAGQPFPDELELPDDADYQGAYEHFISEVRAFLEQHSSK